MYLLLLLIGVAFILVGIIMLIEELRKQGSINLIIGIALIVITIVGIPDVELKYQFSYDIYALEDITTVKGSRYYFEEDFKYYHLARYKDGKKMYAVSRHDSYVVEEDGVHPHIEVYEEEMKTRSKFIKFIYSGIGLEREYKIVVPKGSTTNKYNIDLNKGGSN